MTLSVAAQHRAPFLKSASMRSPSPALSATSAASWVEVAEDVDWDVVSNWSTSSVVFSSASRADAASHPDAVSYPDAASPWDVPTASLAATEVDDSYESDFPPPSLTRVLKQPPSSIPPPPRRLRPLPSSPSLGPGPSPLVLACLGIGLGTSGRRSGLSVTLDHDVRLQPSRRSRASPYPSSSLTPSKPLRVKRTPPRSLHNASLNVDPPPGRDWGDDKDNARSWSRALEEMWKRKRDNKRYPYPISFSGWTVAGSLTLSREFRRLGWPKYADPSTRMLFRSSAPSDLQVLWFSECATAVARALYSAFATRSRERLDAFGETYHRVRGLPRAPSRSLTLQRAAYWSPPVSDACIEWVLGHAGVWTSHWRLASEWTWCRERDAGRDLRFAQFLVRLVELEVRVHFLWEEAKQQGELREEWTPYGVIGEEEEDEALGIARWRERGERKELRYRGKLRGEYLAEPLPETLLVRILLAAANRRPEDVKELVGDACIACGMEVWRDVHTGRAQRRYEGPLEP